MDWPLRFNQLSTTPARLGWQFLYFVGVMVVINGVLAILIGITIQLLPHELGALETTITELESHHEGRLAGFIFHDRVSYSGVLISYVILCIWLARRALSQQRAESWIWWALMISGLVGATNTYGSFIVRDYLDVLVGAVTLCVVAIFLIGLVLAYRGLATPREITSLIHPGAELRHLSRTGLGRLCLLAWAGATALGGLFIFGLGLSDVLVPTDLEFIGAPSHEIEHIHDNLIPFIAHDRLGFGVNLISLGLAAVITVWKGIQPGLKDTLKVFAVIALVMHISAIWIHFIVGYVSFIHLLPFLVKDMFFLVGFILLYRSVFQADTYADDFALQSPQNGGTHP